MQRQAQHPGTEDPGRLVDHKGPNPPTILLSTLSNCPGRELITRPFGGGGGLSANDAPPMMVMITAIGKETGPSILNGCHGNPPRRPLLVQIPEPEEQWIM